MLQILNFFIYAVGIHQLIHLLAYLLNLYKSITAKTDLSIYGQKSWALVTACTDGIGNGFVRELAKHGFNVILVSRNSEKLQQEAKYLQDTYKVETQVVVKDFSECHRDPIGFFGDLEEQVRSRDISIVVNNIGGSRFGLFKDANPEHITLINSLNIWPIAFISRMLLPRMLERNHKGAIINLSSILTENPMPYMVAYCAGKAFDKKLSLVMKLDVDRTPKQSPGIDILCLQPGFVDTQLTAKSKGKILEISPAECASSALRILGKVDYSFGHVKHQLLYFLMRLKSAVTSEAVKPQRGQNNQYIR